MAPAAERVGRALAFVVRGRDVQSDPFPPRSSPRNRLAQELIDPLTKERLQDLAADYIRQAIELERGGPIAPPDIDPTE
jgi:hypothetical protein